MDFVHDNLADGRSFRTLTIIDEFSRECPAMEVDLSLSGHRVVRVLERLARTRGLPQEIGVDKGSEFTSKALTKSALERGVRLHYARPGDKNENVFIESFNGKPRDECLNMHWFSRLSDAGEIIEAWGIDCNEVRRHRSLNGLSPTQYRKLRELKLAA